MKKNILKVAFVVAIALVSGINVFNAHKTETLSDVALANVEALAMDEFNPNISYGYYLKKCRGANNQIIGEKCELSHVHDSKCDNSKVWGNCLD